MRGWYPLTRMALDAAIQAKAPGLKAEESAYAFKLPNRNGEGEFDTMAHLLWMSEKLNEDEESFSSTKAARWIGWMLCAAEALYLWTNDRSRAYITLDVEAGYDVEPKV